VPPGRDQVKETLGAMRAGTDVACATRVAGSALEALRAAWRRDASKGTRAWLPGWAVMRGRVEIRRPSWRSRRVLGERLNRNSRIESEC
jgi:hypothetical protein